MAKRLRYHPLVADDISAAIDWYEGRPAWASVSARLLMLGLTVLQSSRVRETHHVDSTIQPSNGAFHAPYLTPKQT